MQGSHEDLSESIRKERGKSGEERERRQQSKAEAGFHLNFFVRTQLLHQRQKPDAGCLPDMGVRADNVLIQNEVQNPGDHVVHFHVCLNGRRQ